MACSEITRPSRKQKKEARQPEKPSAAAMPPAPAYVPTDRERAAAAALLDRNQQTAPVAKIAVTLESGVHRIAIDHPHPATGTAVFMNALGVRHGPASEALLSQIVNLSGNGQTVTSADVNAVAALVQGIGPRDEIEALLAVQMVAIHNATVTAARRLAHVERIDQQDSASGMLNKLARTFATQVEALKKHRSSGEQNIRVQHVTVNEGGQAIVGSVNTGGGGRHENPLQPQGRIADSERNAALLGYSEALPATLQGPGGERLDRVPMPWGKRGSA